MSLFEANQHKCLDINELDQKASFSNRAQSCLIVPNRVIFPNRQSRQSTCPIHYHFTHVCLSCRPSPTPIVRHYVTMRSPVFRQFPGIEDPEEVLYIASSSARILTIIQW
jgi:hypothetical protein